MGVERITDEMADRIHRVTMFKIADEGQQKQLIEQYKILGGSHKKVCFYSFFFRFSSFLLLRSFVVFASAERRGAGSFVPSDPGTRNSAPP